MKKKTNTDKQCRSNMADFRCQLLQWKNVFQAKKLTWKQFMFMAFRIRTNFISHVLWGIKFWAANGSSGPYHAWDMTSLKLSCVCYCLVGCLPNTSDTFNHLFMVSIIIDCSFNTVSRMIYHVNHLQTKPNKPYLYIYHYSIHIQ